MDRQTSADDGRYPGPTQIPITFSDEAMPFVSSMIVEVEPPSAMGYLIGAAIMMIGVVFPVGYMMFKNKRVPSYSSTVAAAAAVGSSSSGYSKHT